MGSKTLSSHSPFPSGGQGILVISQSQWVSNGSPWSPEILGKHPGSRWGGVGSEAGGKQRRFWASYAHFNHNGPWASQHRGKRTWVGLAAADLAASLSPLSLCFLIRAPGERGLHLQGCLWGAEITCVEGLARAGRATHARQVPASTVIFSCIYWTYTFRSVLKTKFAQESTW